MEEIINTIRCKLFGHKLIYNFEWMPSRAICKRCHTKFAFNSTSLEWYPVDEFLKEKRTDEELIIDWGS